MATAGNGRARWVPLVQRLSFATRSASSWIRRRPDEQGDLCNEQTMSDRLVAACIEDDSKRHRPSLITSHLSAIPAFVVWRYLRSYRPGIRCIMKTLRLSVSERCDRIG